ncbi:MAG: AraC family transcriptional regulator [Gemmatimonadota bacterium]|nr:AraC family transcriptional regulator [Gemmatimonadota bacterium]
MSGDAPHAPLSILTHPYTALHPFDGGRRALKEAARDPGSAVVWQVGSAEDPPEAELLRRRPGGMALLVVLPHAARISGNPELIRRIQELRPHGILPRYDELRPVELAHVLRRPPFDLAVDVTDYIAWRGLEVDQETVRVIRRIVELAEELKSVTALARSLYMSRRALGRRFMSRGLPVPSHWLQMARLLRVSLRLQNSDASVFSVACEFGYPDGFSVSNQMSRLFGFRPTEVRERFGWEWILEAWLRREAEAGALTPTVAGRVRAEADDEPGMPPAMRKPARPGRRVRSAS